MKPIVQVLGATTATTSRLLVLFDDPGATVARVAYDDGGGAGARCVDVALGPAPPFRIALALLTDLAPSATVTYAVDGAADADALLAPDALLASDRARIFRLLPLDRPLRIGLLSCNDVNTSELPAARRGQLWRTLLGQIRAGNVDLLVHAGDQIYGDGEPRTRLPAEDRTTAYRRHYVETWSHPDVASVLATCPSVMMWDDHEIYDGWGSHDDDVTPAARARFEAARTAFHELQVPLNPPGFDEGSAAFCFRHGDVGVLALDGRTHRSWAASTILGEAQLRALDRKLAELEGLAHLFVVVGTPPVYVQSLALEKIAETFGASISDDIRDGWTASRNRNECRRLLMTLLAYAARSPMTQVTILGGDIHVASIGRIDTTLPFAEGRRPRLHQVTSSGIARPPPSGLAGAALRTLVRGDAMALFNDQIVGRLLPLSGVGGYLLDQRNFAVLRMESASGGDWDANGNLWVELFSEGSSDPDRPYEQLLPRLRA